MRGSVDWRDVKYEETFEQELRGLERRRESDQSCRVEDLEGLLRHLYIMDGADWAGRGEVQDIIMAATIAAYEQVIAEWKASCGR
ncbi:MAG: hypothetical protein LBT14_10390 [Treponema sp.]|jgi:hypothetical protein|nr:hypothetical protein [Treponema sp.]